ncbi:HdaA/DnaA family protein [Propylenella binzhouense]|uniref:AAA+ ATPase domain-containing protein n=1 Tax=Propylenella binzhouense TaxID=2555902 RepID=A0A964T4Z2_9HYPH|nr:hypothetical protein [Propylenella binzhouense]MYZ48495.1 hypothetical protein [Propylenella binzhouense]
MPTTTPRQLPLALGHDVQYGRGSYVVGPANRDALAFVERWPDWPGPVLVLSGPAGSGKTHLVHIWAERAGAAIVSGLDAESDGSIAALGRQPLAIDRIAPGRIPERLLFHLINTARENGTALLLAAREPPSAWQVGLPDLASRLRLAAHLRLGEPDEDQLRQVLVKLFTDRQIDVDRAVVDFMVKRMERSFTAAVRLVDTLDEEGLVAGRPITRALAAAVLARTGEAQAFPDSL